MLAAALEEGEPVILGEQLPEWTPDRSEAPPADIVIAADILRQVLQDRDLANRADSRGLTVKGAVIVGKLDLDNSRVGYPLSLINCRLTDSLTLEQATVHALDLKGSHLAGVIRLIGAHISGQLCMRGATLSGTDDDGDTLIADDLCAESSVLLDRGFTAAGAIRLLGARIGGQLSMSGAALDGADTEGDTLIADGLRAESGVFLDKGFTAAGAIRLPGAHIGGRLRMGGATLKGADDRDSLIADNLQANSDVFLDKGFTAAGTISLGGTEIGNLIVGDDPGSLPRLGDVTGWRIRDVHGVIRTDRKVAADWLSRQPASQPWQELAAVYERNGQPADARWMRYRSAVRSTRKTKLPTWLTRQTYRWTTGHGYYPLAALAWLIVIFVIAWALTAIWADDFTTTTTSTIRADLIARAEAATGGQSEDSPIPDPPFPGRVPAAWCTDGWDVTCLNPSIYALTTAFPAAATSQTWAPPTNSWALTVGFHLLRLLAWVFTALLVAGVTGLLRKQT
jgi:hypothetical protein